MKVLVVGGGGREHAICWKLAQSPKVTELYCAPGNGGIAQVAQCVPIKATDVEAMVAWAKENAMDFVMVAPDDPLALGMVDALEAAGIPAFGPRANAAIIEASKAFSKELMKKYHIPTAKYETFTDLDARPGLCPGAGRPHRGEGGRPGPGQGRGGGRHRGGGRGGRAGHDGRTTSSAPPAPPWSSRSAWWAPRSPCWPSATGSTWSPCCPARTTSGPTTATRAPTPAAWAPSAPPPSTPRRSPSAA